MHAMKVTNLSCGNGLRTKNQTQILLKTLRTLGGVPIGNHHESNGLAIQELIRVGVYSPFRTQRTQESELEIKILWTLAYGRPAGFEMNSEEGRGVKSFLVDPWKMMEFRLLEMEVRRESECWKMR